MKTLLLFTGSYPYSAAAEDTFLPQELAVLHEHFDKIVVVPLLTVGTRDALDLPNVIVETGFATYARSRLRKSLRLVAGMIDPEFLSECLTNFSSYGWHSRVFRRTSSFYVQSKLAAAWTARYLHEQQTKSDPIFYTWWFDAATLGLAALGKQRGIPAITRAHGYDLYESRHSPAYIPFRRRAMELIDRVFPDSDAGLRHLISAYPDAANKIEVGLLGIHDPGFLNVASSDGVFRVLSCSFLSPVKRIDLLIRGLVKLGEDCPGARVSWTHLGDGPERAKLQSLAATVLPSNVQWQLPGYPGRTGLYDFYRKQPVDVFVNVSESEGTPVSIMEALSVGLPVLCTAVGGNIETVGNGNGALLSSNPSPSEISQGLQALIQQSERLSKMRLASRELWQNRYNAARNYAAFAESIKRSTGLVPGKELSAT